MVQPIKLVAFVVVMIAYLWVPISTITQQEKVLKKGATYLFKPRPVDPYDAFRGRFIWVSIPTPWFDLPPAEPPFTDYQKAYVILARDSSGYAFFEGISHYEPEDRDYMQVQVLHYDGERQKVRVDLPNSIQKYYLNEKLAPLAESTYQDLLRRNREGIDSVGVSLEVKVLNGRALMETIYFDGQKIEDYLRQAKTNG
ncbi:MAG: GDYXXLXY domain-containing protein [Bacteroidota bacterium]